MDVLIVTLFCLLLQASRGIPNIFHLISFIQKQNNSSYSKNDIVPKFRKWFILLPLFKEQKIVNDTITKLLSLPHEENVFVVTVTSSKEKGEKNTQSIIEHGITNRLWGNDTDRVLFFNEENENSSMATQLNFALNKLANLDPENLNAFFLLYNADSRPSHQTLHSFEEKVNSLNIQGDFAMQQPCAFIKDVGLKSSFVDALSIYQTWFCLGCENRILNDYEKKALKSVGAKRGYFSELLASPLGYCVGHGSSMKLSTLLNKGGYPDKFLTEDLTLGYFLSADRVPIVNIDILEVADVPFNFVTYTKQRSVWFWNYIEYVSCFFDKRVSKVPLARRMGLLAIGLGRGLHWFFSSIFYFLPIILGILYKDVHIIYIGIAGIFIFQLMPMLYIINTLPQILEKQGLKVHADNLKTISKTKTLSVTLLLVLTDSLGPWLALSKSVWYLSQKRRPLKYKTDR